MQNKIVYLVGFMGSGKSTLGKKMANSLGFTRIDLDEVIETKTALPIKNIFTFWGEDKFRNIESECLKELNAEEGMVVSCGGGTACFHNNMDWMKNRGITVFIDLSLSHIISRLILNPKKRPLLVEKTEDEIKIFVEELYQKRIPFYQMAQLRFNPMEDDYDEFIQKIKLLISNSHL